jgi:hypothetical protein
MGAAANQPIQNVFQGSSAALQQAGQTYGGMTGFQPSAAQYMNPYTEQVIERTQQDIARQQQVAQNQLGAQAQAAGAFGGSRHGVAQGVMAGEYGRMAGDIAAQQRQQGYNQALDTAFRTAGIQQAGASGLAGLGGQLFGMGQQTQQAISGQGQFQRQLQQAMLDAAKNQFYGTAGAPLQGLGALSSVLSGITVPTSTSSTTSTGASSPYDPTGLLVTIAAKAAGLPI